MGVKGSDKEREKLIDEMVTEPASKLVVGLTQRNKSKDFAREEVVTHAKKEADALDTLTNSFEKNALSQE